MVSPEIRCGSIVNREGNKKKKTTKRRKMHERFGARIKRPETDSPRARLRKFIAALRGIIIIIIKIPNERGDGAQQ